MKRVFAALAVASLTAPAMAQAPTDDVRAFMTNYVAAFNKGDAAALAKEFYAAPGLAAAGLSLIALLFLRRPAVADGMRQPA